MRPGWSLIGCSGERLWFQASPQCDCDVCVGLDGGMLPACPGVWSWVVRVVVYTHFVYSKDLDLPKSTLMFYRTVDQSGWLNVESLVQ